MYLIWNLNTEKSMSVSYVIGFPNWLLSLMAGLYQSAILYLKVGEPITTHLQALFRLHSLCTIAGCTFHLKNWFRFFWRLFENFSSYCCCCKCCGSYLTAIKQARKAVNGTLIELSNFSMKKTIVSSINNIKWIKCSFVRVIFEFVTSLLAYWKAA